MSAFAQLSVDPSAPPGERSTSNAAPLPLPPAIEAAIWRADQFGKPVTSVLPTGFTALDAELPGGGWPRHALTELLQPQPTVTEWRLLGPAMRQVVAAGADIVIVGPPKAPHLPGLQRIGVDERRLVWLQADSPGERLWVTEQLVKANACGLLVAWLTQARQEQIRRLQVCAQSNAGRCSCAARLPPRTSHRLRRCACRWASVPTGNCTCAS